MKRFAIITVFVSGLVIIGALSGLAPGVAQELENKVHAGRDRILTLDVACDCRMASPAFVEGNRGDAWIVTGKIFPAGTLPAGDASNDPTLPVSGVAPIGEWTCRGQNALPFPSVVGAAYNASPVVFNTQYFLFNNERSLTLEGYVLPEFAGERLSVTGGVGACTGAAGYVKEAPFGTNATGCPNFRAEFNLQPGSVRDHLN